MTVTERKPSDPVNDYIDSYAWSCTGWEDAVEGSIRAVEHATRGQAAAWFAQELGDSITNVRVWKRYVRALTRQESWDEHGGRERWEERHDIEDDEGPGQPPGDWMPSECAPVWEFVHRSEPAAVAVWVCGSKGDEPPQNPRAKVVTLDSGDGVAPRKKTAA